MAIRILTKLKFRFRNGKDDFVSKGQNLIEDAPDWIEKDGIFELAVKDGSLVKLDTATIVQGSSPAVKETKPEPEEVPKPKAAPAKKAPAKKTASRKK